MAKCLYVIFIYIMFTVQLFAQPFDLASLIPGEQRAAERGQRMDIGVATLEGSKEAEVYSYQSFKLIYTAGKAGVKSGGKILVGLRHVLGWTTAQTTDPTADGYLAAVASNGAMLSIYVEQNQWVEGSPYTWRLFPWQNLIEIELGDPGLTRGDTVTIVIGEQSQGSKGVRIQPVDEYPFVFKFYVDIAGSGDYLPLKENPFVNIIPAEPYRLNIVMPSHAQMGQPTWCIVRAEDRYGNPAIKYQGTVQFKSSGKNEHPQDYTFQKSDKGVHRFDNIVFKSQGLATLTVHDEKYSATSNPVQVFDRIPEKTLYWGDLHGHTLFSDGRGSPEQFYDFAENVAGLDFCALTDHGFEITDDMWEYSKRITNSAYKPGKFVTLQAYEWSGMEDVGGDHNVFFLDDDPPLYRSRSYYNYENFQMYHGIKPQVNHVEDLFKVLAKDFQNERVFCIPHWGGRHGNPAWHQSEIQRAIEVFSEHRRSEDWMTAFLQKGYRIGIMASTDGHMGNPGYGYLKIRQPMDWNTQEIGMASVAVYADDLTRESIFKAVYNRHVYATSGERIILDFDVNGAHMGSEITAEMPPIIHLYAVGTKDIKKIYVKKNSQIVKTFYPGKIDARYDWQDDNFQTDTSCYYYIHVIQKDDEEAISSPVWVN